MQKHHALHSYLLVRAKPRFTMSRRQRTTPLDEENSIPPTLSFLIALNHERLEVWFKGHEDRIQTFLIKITRKQMIIPKVLCLSCLRVKNFGTLEQHFKSKKLRLLLNF